MASATEQTAFTVAPYVTPTPPRTLLDYLWALSMLTIPTVTCIGVVVLCVYLCLVLPVQRRGGNFALSADGFPVHQTPAMKAAAVVVAARQQQSIFDLLAPTPTPGGSRNGDIELGDVDEQAGSRHCSNPEDDDDHDDDDLDD